MKEIIKKLKQKIVHRLGGITIDELCTMQTNIDRKNKSYSIENEVEIKKGLLTQR